MSRFLYDAQQALSFLISQTTHIEAEVYETQYPDIQYAELIPVDTSANAWARSVTYFSTDKVGRAGWFHARSKDMHVADINRTKNEVGIEMADIGYEYDLEELNVAMMVPGTNLTSDRASAAVRSYEEFIDDAALNGKPEKNFEGLVDYPGITTVTAGIVAGHSLWSLKPADDIIADVNNSITGIYTESLQVEMADTVLLPVEAITLISTKRVPDTQMTVLEYLLKNNVYTAITGRPLTIRGVRGLSTAGAGGTGRMIAYRRDPQVLKMHLPMPHQFLPVWQMAPLVFAVPGIFRFGGLEIRRPKSVRYVDGITTVDITS